MIFNRNAPATVRIGAVGALLAALADSAVRIGWSWSMPPSEATLWTTIVRPLISFVVGVCFAWGIAQLNGLFYWSWFIVSLILIVTMLVMPIYRLFLASPDIGAVTVGPSFFIVGLLWLLTTAMLLTPSSIRAFWSHGHLGLGRDVR